MKSHQGSATVELVLLAPVLMILILFGVYSGRASGSAIQVRHAADQAARGASKVSRSRVDSTAFQVVERVFADESSSCRDFSVQTSIVDQDGDSAVRVEVSCMINTQGLMLLGVTQRRVSAISTEVFDRWRVD